MFKPSNGDTLVDSRVADGGTVCEAVPAAIAPEHTFETVLLVEDEPSVRALAGHLLRSAGYRILEAIDGVEALRLADGYPGTIDLLMTDVIMPHLGGAKLAERLALLRPGTPVLFMSGHPDHELVRNGVLGAVVAFLQKPFTGATMLRVVRETLASRGDSTRCFATAEHDC